MRKAGRVQLSGLSEQFKKLLKGAAPPEQHHLRELYSHLSRGESAMVPAQFRHTFLTEAGQAGAFLIMI